MSRAILLIVAAGIFAALLWAEALPVPTGRGVALKPSELRQFSAIAPDGTGLPPGQGTARQGATIYAARCAACHGANLEGIQEAGGAALIGGRGTLASAAPLRTVESYWPYATTLFDYIKRAMPFEAPGSLNDNEVYNLTAFILAKGAIIKPEQVMNAQSLPKVTMPNRNGFIRDPRPAPVLPKR